MLLSVMSLAMAAVGAGPQKPHQEVLFPPPMKCETGPVNRTFGGTEWIVYSCSDQTSMVVISVRGNPASPFYFFLKPTGSGYIIRGEGNGDEQASTAAGDAIAKMTPAELGALLAATKSATR
jgi:hypothetical protein